MILKTILELIKDTYPVSEPVEVECAICGEPLNDGGVLFKKLLTVSSFNLNHEIYNANLTHVCSACAVFFSRQNWVAYCERNNKNPYFPTVEGKKRSVANWFFFSHYFAKNDHRIVTKRQDWRGYLTNPPKPPFCFVLSTICKKHLIFKAEMAYDRDVYPIRFEGSMITIVTERFSKCLAAFEALYEAGLSKSSIKTGDYSTTALLTVDRELLIHNDDILKEFRRLDPDYLAICEFIGGRYVS